MTLSLSKRLVLPLILLIISEREEWETTAELISDEKLLMDYKAAREEIKKGNTARWKAIKRNV